MYAPGLRSLLTNFDLVLNNLTLSESTYNKANFLVTSVHPLFHRCEISVTGTGWQGKIHSLIRPGPCEQISFSKAQSIVKPKAFSGQRAFILGGSRGAGEATAKLLAAGDADVVLSYARGKDDAIRVANEILNGGKRAQIVALNIDSSSWDLQKIFPLDWSPTHFYYFATPAISGDGFNYSSALFENYFSCYVDKFIKIFEEIYSVSQGLNAVFWPSSTAVDEVPSGMVEYAMAKSAGEAMCASIAQKNPRIKMFAPRLPRLRTDLTATPFNVNTSDAAEVLLPILEKMQFTASDNYPSAEKVGSHDSTF